MKTPTTIPKKAPRSGAAVAAQHRRAGKMHDRRAPRGNPRTADRQAVRRGDWS